MASNTRFNIDLDSGNFIVTSNENIYDYTPRLIPRLIESHFFQSEWDFDNNLIKFSMDNEDAVHHLQDEKSTFYSIANRAKKHHYSVMRYERI